MSHESDVKTEIANRDGRYLCRPMFSLGPPMSPPTDGTTSASWYGELHPHTPQRSVAPPQVLGNLALTSHLLMRRGASASPSAQDDKGYELWIELSGPSWSDVRATWTSDCQSNHPQLEWLRQEVQLITTESEIGLKANECSAMLRALLRTQMAAMEAAFANYQAMSPGAKVSELSCSQGGAALELSTTSILGRAWRGLPVALQRRSRTARHAEESSARHTQFVNSNPTPFSS